MFDSLKSLNSIETIDYIDDGLIIIQSKSYQFKISSHEHEHVSFVIL